MIDGRRIARVDTFVVNRAPMIRVTFEDRTTRTLHPTAYVKVGGYQESLPAGPVRGNDLRDPKPNSRARVSDGRWEGEAGGFSVDQISRMRNYDLAGREPQHRREAPAGLRRK